MNNAYWNGISNQTIVNHGKSSKNPDQLLTEIFVNRGFNTKFTNGNLCQRAPCALTEVRLNIENTWGVTSEFNYDDFTLHLAYMDASEEKAINTYADNSEHIDKFPWREFIDVALRYDDGNWFVLAEMNQYRHVYSSYYMTIGKTVGDYQLLLTKGNYDGEVKLSNGFVLPDGQQEFTNNQSISLRYDMGGGLALKAEYIKFNNTGSFFVPDINNDGKIESDILSFAVDFVF